MDEEESEPFTDIYWIKFVKIANARYSSLCSKAFLKGNMLCTNQELIYIYKISSACRPRNSDH